MLYTLYYLSNLLLCRNYYQLICTVTDFEITKSKPVLISSLLISAAVPMLFVVPSSLLPGIVRVLLLFAVMLLKAGCCAAIFRQVNLKMLYISVLSFVTNANFSIIVQFFITDSLPKNILAVCSEALFILVLMIWIRKKRYQAVIRSSIHVIPRSLYLAILLFLYVMSFFEYTSIVPQLSHIARFMILPVVFIISCIIARIIKISVQEKEMEQINKTLLVQQENQLAYYRKINEVYAEFRGFRHDLSNHIFCIRSLINENEPQKALRYIDEIEQMSHSSKEKSFDTGNIIVDALLNDKNNRATACNSRIVFSGCAPAKGITSIALCTIIANAVDNAIEACEKDISSIPKEIRINSQIRQGCFFFRISNPMFDKLKLKSDNRIRTTKSDTTLHGFGMTNIIKTVEKYHGNVAFFSKDNHFVLEIDLILNPEE